MCVCVCVCVRVCVPVCVSVEVRILLMFQITPCMHFFTIQEAEESSMLKSIATGKQSTPLTFRSYIN